MASKILRAPAGASVNLVWPRRNCRISNDGFVESRLVLRPAKLCIYVSSHARRRSSDCYAAGCPQCHLTTTGQRRMLPETAHGLWDQYRRVFDEWKNLAERPAVQKVHCNFMARGGDPLLNPVVRQWEYLSMGLLKLHNEGFELENRCGWQTWNELENARAGPMGWFRQPSLTFNIPTIMPKQLEQKIRGQMTTFAASTVWPRLYYSLWSVDRAWKSRRMPSAMDEKRALAALAEYQSLIDERVGNGPEHVVVHGAFVEHENDSQRDVEALADAIVRSGLRTRFNLLRYDPPALATSCASGILSRRRESPHAVELFEYIRDRLAKVHPIGSKGKIIERVGLDDGGAPA